MAHVEWGSGPETLVQAEETSKVKILRHRRQTAEWDGGWGEGNGVRGCWTSRGHTPEGAGVHGRELGFYSKFHEKPLDPFEQEFVVI